MSWNKSLMRNKKPFDHGVTNLTSVIISTIRRTKLAVLMTVKNRDKHRRSLKATFAVQSRTHTILENIFVKNSY